MPSDEQLPHRISVVVPVYQGRSTLPALVTELEPLTSVGTTPAGRAYVVDELVLVDDCGPDGSDAVVRELAAEHDWVRAVWLSRNFGQHAATLAGISASGGEWVVTMDEDGQHDPADIGVLLDAAMSEQADVVYARPSNQPPHGAARNLASRSAKWIVGRMAKGAPAADFNSFRLVLGEVARSVAAYAGPGIYLDVAISWVARRTTTAGVPMREEGGRPSGYDLRRLASHFWRLVLSSGTTPLRLVSVTGAAAVVLAPLVALVLVVGRVSGSWEAPGWTSTMVLLMASTGAILFALGVIAEYVGMAVNMAMGKPLYLPVRDRRDGPLGRDQA
ncbi:glycosyltransferase family 2 protein [Phycicoccus sp. DTK01]|uniref:glycosyltransferase family 2 protein n=1 Tax=Phycicoccus sp. DTK01 TaxID=2785745 RepID=UPI001A8E163F|nr:glycosyltransferase family 2 protein [Phycicoccus sp. DTK01]GIL35682.1 glycosyl transferase [Phycicoccus sp. DTK01]